MPVIPSTVVDHAKKSVSTFCNSSSANCCPTAVDINDGAVGKKFFELLLHVLHLVGNDHSNSYEGGPERGGSGPGAEGEMLLLDRKSGRGRYRRLIPVGDDALSRKVPPWSASASPAGGKAAVAVSLRRTENASSQQYRPLRSQRPLRSRRHSRKKEKNFLDATKARTPSYVFKRWQSLVGA